MIDFDSLTAAQKVRYRLTGDPFKDPTFETEGPDVIRWWTGGTLPDRHVTYHPSAHGDVTVRCATCSEVLGMIPSDRFDKAGIVAAMGAIREMDHPHN